MRMARPDPARRRLLVVHVTTVPMSLTFLRGQASFMRQRGIELRFVSSPGPELQAFANEEGVRAEAVPMPRRITPLEDLRAVLQLRTLLRRWSPDVVHGHTPKGGLLAMLAATAAGVRRRIYHMRGLPFVGENGLRRALLLATERTSCALAHEVVCVSNSLREVAANSGIAARGRLRVLAHGSGQGVDAAGRFDPSRFSSDEQLALREWLGVGNDALLVLFVGRVVGDKGVAELWQAWEAVRERHPGARLVLAGPFEERDGLPAELRARMTSDPRAHILGHVPDPAPLYAIADVVVLPTYREGFPNVLLEAAAMAKPAVATRVTGCVDAVVDGVTGTLVPPGNASAIAEALDKYLVSPWLRSAHGRAARARAVKDFKPEDIWRELASLYDGRS